MATSSKAVSYANYRDSGAGYSPYQQSAQGYNNVPSVTTYATTPTPATPARGDELFNSLPALSEGVGPYHINHYVAFFDAPKLTPSDCPKLLTAFYNKFPFIFSNAFTGNYASAAWGKGTDAGQSQIRSLTFQSHQTVKFALGGQFGGFVEQMIGFAHDDWVAMQMEPQERKSFYALTLKRKWMTIQEAAAVGLAAAAVAGPIVGTLGGGVAIDINQHHFLAGRRSWRVGFDLAAQLFFVETAALERSSGWFYSLMEGFPWLRSQVDKIWIALLGNFVTVFNNFSLNIGASPLYTDPQSPYSLSSADVFHVAAETDSLPDALKVDWFSEVIKRHVGLITDL